MWLAYGSVPETVVHKPTDLQQIPAFYFPSSHSLTVFFTTFLLYWEVAAAVNSASTHMFRIKCNCQTNLHTEPEKRSDGFIYDVSRPFLVPLRRSLLRFPLVFICLWEWNRVGTQTHLDDGLETYRWLRSVYSIVFQLNLLRNFSVDIKKSIKEQKLKLKVCRMFFFSRTTRKIVIGENKV